MPSPDAAARHTGAGVARRQGPTTSGCATSAREAAAGDAELPPEDDAVEMASAAQLLDSVAEAGPNYTLLRSKVQGDEGDAPEATARGCQGGARRPHCPVHRIAPRDLLRQ